MYELMIAFVFIILIACHIVIESNFKRRLAEEEQSEEGPSEDVLRLRESTLRLEQQVARMRKANQERAWRAMDTMFLAFSKEEMEQQMMKTFGFCIYCENGRGCPLHMTEEEAKKMNEKMDSDFRRAQQGGFEDGQF